MGHHVSVNIYNKLIKKRGKDIAKKRPQRYRETAVGVTMALFSEKKVLTKTIKTFRKKNS